MARRSHTVFSGPFAAMMSKRSGDPDSIGAMILFFRRLTTEAQSTLRRAKIHNVNHWKQLTLQVSFPPLDV